MSFEDYKHHAVKHVVLPSTEGCEGGPLAFDLIMPPSVVINPLAYAFYEKIKPYQDNESAEANEARTAAGLVLYVELLKACGWPEGFALEDINDMDDLNYLMQVAAVFFVRGNKTQTTAGVSPAVSETAPAPSLEPDSSGAGTSPATV
jgi:hypothetical protein